MTEAGRLQAFCSRMKELDLDYLLVYFNGIHSFLDPNLVFLLSDFKSIGESMIVLHANGTSTLLVTPSWDLNRAQKQAKCDQVIATDDLASALQHHLASTIQTTNQVGFLGAQQLRRRDHAAYAPYLNLKRGDLQIDERFRDLMACKTPAEIERAQIAAQIAESGYKKMLEIARPGIYEYELAGEVSSYIRSLGCYDNFMLMNASQHHYSVRPPGGRRLEEGDIILAEISPCYEGQFIQMCRSVVIGESKKQLLQEKYELLIQAYECGLKAAKPGVRMSEVFTQINQPLVEAGYGEYCQPPYMRVRGHGLGLSSIFPGDVSGENETILREGMLFIIHPNQYIPETGYLLCGETVVITAEGAKPLTRRKPAIDFV